MISTIRDMASHKADLSPMILTAFSVDSGRYCPSIRMFAPVSWRIRLMFSPLLPSISLQY